MYQPREQEIASLWPSLKTTSPDLVYYQQARDVLTAVDANFVYDPSPARGWGCRGEHSIHIVHVVDGTPTCTCGQYHDTPMKSPRGIGTRLRFVDHCQHTLAYIGYREILAHWSDWVQFEIPTWIHLLWIKGMTQPSTPYAMAQFADWLQTRQAMIVAGEYVTLQQPTDRWKTMEHWQRTTRPTQPVWTRPATQTN